MPLAVRIWEHMVDADSCLPKLFCTLCQLTLLHFGLSTTAHTVQHIQLPRLMLAGHIVEDHVRLHAEQALRVQAVCVGKSLSNSLQVDSGQGYAMSANPCTGEDLIGTSRHVAAMLHSSTQPRTNHASGVVHIGESLLGVSSSNPQAATSSIIDLRAYKCFVLVSMACLAARMGGYSAELQVSWACSCGCRHT